MMEYERKRKMKKIVMSIVFVFLIGMVSACGDKTQQESSSQTDSNTKIHEHCTRTGTIDDNSSVDLSYEIYYTGERLNRVEAYEKVTSSSQETLKTYQDAYEKIQSYYKGLAYYDAEVKTTSDSVESIIKIDYDHIDIAKLIAIEGEDDNVFENNIPKISKWKELADKVGTKCTQVS